MRPRPRPAPRTLDGNLLLWQNSASGRPRGPRKPGKPAAWKQEPAYAGDARIRKEEG